MILVIRGPESKIGETGTEALTDPMNETTEIVMTTNEEIMSAISQNMVGIAQTPVSLSETGTFPMIIATKV